MKQGRPLSGGRFHSQYFVEAAEVVEEMMAEERWQGDGEQVMLRKSRSSGLLSRVTASTAESWATAVRKDSVFSDGHFAGMASEALLDHQDGMYRRMEDGTAQPAGNMETVSSVPVTPSETEEEC